LQVQGDDGLASGSGSAVAAATGVAEVVKMVQNLCRKGRETTAAMRGWKD
jgi:hypothetical protein